MRCTLFDYLENGKRNAGVRVATTAGKEREIPCAGPVVSQLSQLRGVLRCDPDNALSLGECRRSARGRQPPASGRSRS